MVAPSARGCGRLVCGRTAGAQPTTVHTLVGCPAPHTLAALIDGETVVDLGSGFGLSRVVTRCQQCNKRFHTMQGIVKLGKHPICSPLSNLQLRKRSNGNNQEASGLWFPRWHQVAHQVLLLKGRNSSLVAFLSDGAVSSKGAPLLELELELWLV